MHTTDIVSKETQKDIACTGLNNPLFTIYTA